MRASTSILNWVSDRRDGTESVTVLIPVFGNLEVAQECIDLAIQSLEELPLQGCLVAVDDGMPDYMRRVFDRICLERDISLLRSSANLGFRRVVNASYALLDGDWTVLLNSDVLLPRHALRKLLAVAVSDQRIALVSPLATSGPPLEVILEPGQHWLELSKLLDSGDDPFIEACTTVGYCLLVRREAVEDGVLFDATLPDAYGEDTDLHFRLCDAGWLGVVATSCLVFHQGGGSYRWVPQAAELRQSARAHFTERWGETWRSQFPSFQRRFEESTGTRNGEIVESRWVAHRDVVLISPGHDHRASGGVAVIWRMADFLARSFPKTSVVSLDLAPGDEPPWDGSRLRATSWGRVSSADVVIATAPWTWNYACALASRTSSPIVTLIQGLDFLLNPSATDVMIEMLKASDLVVTTSKYLEDFARKAGSRHILRIDVSPNPLEFLAREEERDADVLLVTRQTPLKGAELATGMAAWLTSLGFSTLTTSSHGYRHESGRAPNWVPRELMPELLARARVVVDLSLTEGFGLLPREALLMGCGVVLSRSGGGTERLEKHPRVRVLERTSDPWEVAGAVEDLLAVISERESDESLPFMGFPTFDPLASRLAKLLGQQRQQAPGQRGARASGAVVT